MIRIFLTNEQLDLDADSLVTFKQSQLLNGVQVRYSYSNTFNLKNSSKNRRLLGITYLPNSKTQSMSAGYTVDVVMNGCIFLKGQTLKVSKENIDTISVYLVFTDSYFVAKAKDMLMTQLDTGVNYEKTLANFLALNDPAYTAARTAPISAQDSSGHIAVEESVILLNLKNTVTQIFEQLGYSYLGDILTDEDLPNYYISSNVGLYGTDGTPQFDENMTVYDFMSSFLETFNAFIEVSDSSQTIGLYFWKNIESRKATFVDYSDKFTGFTDYSFETRLANKNTLAYSDSPDYYNGYFDNNKSLVDSAEYLVSDFGAGNLRLFDDQERDDTDGMLPLRDDGDTTDPQTMNIFKFEVTTTRVAVFYEGWIFFQDMYKAVSPNIVEIWQLFHKAYTNNIALPTVANLVFRYDAVFLSSFSMTEVFYTKQLATYWLPLELNFTTAKDKVQIKALMIETTAVDAPVVFDLSLSVGFYGDVYVEDLDLLYAAYNASEAATMVITAADLTKNDIYINDEQVLSFPMTVDVSEAFELKVSNIEETNAINNSDISFQFVSDEGGYSRTGKINVTHNGSANFISEFRSEVDTTYTYTKTDTNGVYRRLNYSARVNTPINIATTLSVAIGDVAWEKGTEFNVLEFDRDSYVSVALTIGHLHLQCSNRGGGAEARTKIYFNVWKNGVKLLTVYSNGVIDRYKNGDREADYYDIAASSAFSVLAGDIISIEALALLSEEDRAGSGTMDGSISLTNVVWIFSVNEQL